MEPIELRLNKAKTPTGTYYTVDKVWPGVGNVTFGQRLFTTLRDATDWCKREWHGIPLIRNY